MKHTARKIDTGLYEYRGHTIESLKGAQKWVDIKCKEVA